MSVIVLKRQTGRAHTADLLASDTAQIPGTLVISGTSTAGTEVLRVQGETQIEGTLHGQLNGTGLIIGVAGASPSTGSALQIASFTTTQRGNLSTAVGTAGMRIYNSTLTKFQNSNGLRWGDESSNNYQASTDPSTANDITQGYTVGSRWLNTTTQIEWVCTNSTGAAAVWVPSTNNGQSLTNQLIIPGQHLLFNFADYPNTGKVTASEVQYTKVYLIGGTVITKMQLFINNGATGNINMGLYDQATALSATGTPRNLVASTGSTAISSGDNGTFKIVNLSGSYTVATTGYYWIAMIGSSVTPRYAASNQYLAGYAPINFETSSGVVLPTGPSHSLASATATAIIYVAATE